LVHRGFVGLPLTQCKKVGARRCRDRGLWVEADDQGRSSLPGGLGEPALPCADGVRHIIATRDEARPRRIVSGGGWRPQVAGGGAQTGSDTFRIPNEVRPHGEVEVGGGWRLAFGDWEHKEAARAARGAAPT
jgi:hypothetical protein